MVGWRTLHLDTHGSQAPLLLIKHNVRATEYSVHVTDLVHIWTEHLDRKSIIRRALAEDTSIDPSEGSNQLSILLQHIRLALEGGEGTRLQLRAGKDRSDCILHLSATLPAPLQPLEWHVDLSRAAQDELVKELLLPSFENLKQKQLEVLSLLALVQAKDRVLGKLTDKLESAGVELGTVFPGVALSKGSRAAPQDLLLRSVPALVPFDRHGWETSLKPAGATGPDDLLGTVLAEVGESTVAGQWKPAGEWWTAIGENVCKVRSPSLYEPERQDREMHVDSSDSEDFQRQETPKLANDNQSADLDPVRILVKDSQLVSARDDDDGSTTGASDDDLDAPVSKVSPAAPAKQHAAAPVRKIGMVGGRRHVQVPAPVLQGPLPSAGESVASDIDRSAQAADQAADQDTPATSVKPSGKLGKIGGRSGRTRPEDNGNGRLPLHSDGSRGAVGGQDDDAEGRGGRAVKKPEDPAPRETSSQRADRKRAELKRELEAKRNAPAKKKRKF